jgi:hypothetical protein
MVWDQIVENDVVWRPPALAHIAWTVLNSPRPVDGHRHVEGITDGQR